MISKDKILELYKEFSESYHREKYNEVWSLQSKKFKEFWNQKVMNEYGVELNDQEIDEIVRILDRHGKGNTKDSSAIARVMIPQGVWRRLFNELVSNQKLSNKINEILNNTENRNELINELYQLNEGKKNSLTGKSGNAINSLIAAYDPFNNLSMVSLNDRYKLIKNIINNNPEELDLIGDKIVNTSDTILNFFKLIGINENARTISVFCYYSPFKRLWKEADELDNEDIGDVSRSSTDESSEQLDYLFYMEKQLEDFLIENWDKTELGEKYDLIEKDGEVVSQQYRTPIGIIDILAKDKKDGRYVIIELKKNQSSDDTIGQIARYMGWVETHLSGGVQSKGLIIAGKYDERLFYAMKKIHDIEVFIYKVDFHLNKFSKEA